jgi:hypothetical protein
MGAVSLNRRGCALRVAGCFAAGLLLLTGLMPGAGCSRDKAHSDYLVRVGTLTLTLVEFNQAVRAAQVEAFPGEADIDSSMLDDLRLRVLNQLSEEMILAAYAADRGIEVSEEALDKAVAAIKADYPDDTFEETLLENAVSFQLWKRKLAARLLAEKVIAQELIEQVRITTGDVAGYYETHYPEGIPENADTDDFKQRIVTHLRRQKAEMAYKEWIADLRQSYPVEINHQVWESWVASDPPEPAPTGS